MFFDRPASGECAVLVHLNLSIETDREDPREFEELVLSAGGDPVAFVFGQRHAPHPHSFVGAGKLEEVAEQVRLHQAEVVLFNHALSPGQQRNLERALECRVTDRTGLILDIFAQRARTHEGKLQVELAQLQHISTRLVHGWTHLERQKGGIGLRGPGETQLESDRRLIRARIKTVTGRLEKVEKQRELGRRSRRRAALPCLCLVGYTNAGKSTLFNALTASEVYVADQLFATLDPTLRHLDVANCGPVVLADTVGFIRHLPHKLVEAFRATLAETTNADLLLHVIDVASAERLEQTAQVEEVLAEIGAQHIPRLEVFNKLDLLAQSPRVDRDENGRPVRVWLSAQSGAGLELLPPVIAELLGNDMVQLQVRLTPAQGSLRAHLYQFGAVLQECHGDDGGSMLRLRLPRRDWLRLLASEGVAEEQLAGANQSHSVLDSPVVYGDWQ